MLQSKKSSLFAARQHANSKTTTWNYQLLDFASIFVDFRFALSLRPERSWDLLAPCVAAMKFSGSQKVHWGEVEIVAISENFHDGFIDSMIGWFFQGFSRLFFPFSLWMRYPGCSTLPNLFFVDALPRLLHSPQSLLASCLFLFLCGCATPAAPLSPISSLWMRYPGCSTLPNLF